MKKKCSFFISLISILAFISSTGACYVNLSMLDPDTRPMLDPDTQPMLDPDTQPMLDPDASWAPDWVRAAFSINAEGKEYFQVTWEAVAPQYSVYRRLGSGDWEPVALQISGTSCQDELYYSSLVDPRQPKAVQYAVRSILGSQQSDYSDPSKATSPVVLETWASLLSETGKNHVQWAEHPEAQSYKLYRSATGPGASAAPLLLAEELPAGQPLQWDDIPETPSSEPKSSTPYYYLVTWVKDEVEYGVKDGLFALGAYTSVIDYYEPNDEWSILPDQSTMFTDLQPPLNFSMADGYGGEIQDTDWYRYDATAGVVFSVEVTLPSDTPFVSGDLTFQFYYNGVFYPASAPQSIYTGFPGTNEFFFTQFASGATGAQTVYFVIKPNLGINRDVIGTYSVKIN